jgi:hypothetical protein
VIASASNDDCRIPTSACYLSYFRRENIVDPMAALKSLGDACPTRTTELDKRFGLSKEVLGEELLVSVVGGLQSFLEERAKAEALDYTLDQLKDRLCTPTFSPFMVQTCQLIGAPDLHIDEPTLVRLKQALIADLDQLPSRIVAQLPATKDPQQLALRLFGQSGGQTALELSESKIGLNEIPATWAKKDREGYASAKLALRCTMLDDKNPMSLGCWVLLAPELGSAAVEQKAEPTPESIAAVVERAAQAFCSAYGVENQTENGKCLLGAATQSPLATLTSKASADIKTLVIASLRFVQLGKQAELLAKQGTPFSEIVTRLLPDLATAFDGWDTALQKVLPTLPASDKQNIDTVAFVLRATSAAASRNYPMLLAEIAGALEPGQPLEKLKVKVPPAVMGSLGFAARLAAAQKPDDAKKAFEDEAAPLGSYKVKYDRSKVTIAINAFVGPFVGGGWQYDVKNASDDTHLGLVARPLSAPIGVDFTLLSGKYFHFGLLASVIDPFAVGTVYSNANAEAFDWGALLTPGAMARVGIGGSPFTLLGGFTYQPLAKSKDTCTENNASVPCWKGALQVGGALAIDVPLLVLR